MVNRTSIDLGDAYHIALKNSNGNMSEYLRRLVHQDHQKKQIQNKTNNQIQLLQHLSFLFLGILFFILAINTTIDIPSMIQLSLFSFGGLLLILLSIITYKTRQKIEVKT